jgi:hypothetical protein
VDTGTFTIGNYCDLKLGVDYLNAVRPNYTPLAYPHPLTGVVSPPSTNPPSIISQPQGQSIPAGGSVYLFVAVMGSNLSYAWQVNNVAIAGATNSSLTLNPAAVSDTGNYVVSVSNPFGSVVSAQAAVTVVSSMVLPPTKLTVGPPN